MILAFCIGVFILICKVTALAFRASWTIFKGLFYIMFCPAVLLVLFFWGIKYVAVPLLVVALILAFILPLFSKQ